MARTVYSGRSERYVRSRQQALANALVVHIVLRGCFLLRSLLLHATVSASSSVLGAVFWTLVSGVSVRIFGWQMAVFGRDPVGN